VPLRSARSERAQAWRDLALSALAIGSVAIGFLQLSRADGDTRMTWLDWLDLAIVAVFWVDFVTEVRRWGSLRAYARKHWWELPSLIPALPALAAVFPPAPFLRALRLLRLARVVSVLMRLRPAGAYLVRVARRARIDIILGTGAVIVFLSTVLAYVIESRVNPDMETWGKAFWFAFNMFTNVAFVDYHPVTDGGRALAGVLQLCGIAFIGIFTASLAGVIMRDPPPERGPAERD
jgi:voltage-gated potassium channel